MTKKKVVVPEKEKPKDLIEDIYPHEFWLEKYNKLNRRQVIVFDKYTPHINGK